MNQYEILIDKADKMERAFSKLISDLAKDGTAIEGLTDAINAQHEYVAARLDYELHLFSTSGKLLFVESKS
jgi:hypothetical protein